jgi:hypothetical protein
MALFSAFPFHAICLSSDSTTTGGLAVFLSFFAFCLRACFSGVSVFLRKMGTGHRIWRHTDTDRSFVFMETLSHFVVSFLSSPWTAWTSSSRPCHFSISESFVSVPPISVGCSYLRFRVHEWGFDDNDRDEAFRRTCTINYVFFEKHERE